MPQKSKGSKKRFKSSDKVCRDLGAENVELEFTDADYQNLTLFSLFVRLFRPNVLAVNPNLSVAKVTQILEAKWLEFQAGNPYNKESDVDSEQDSAQVSNAESTEVEEENEDPNENNGNDMVEDDNDMVEDDNDMVEDDNDNQSLNSEDLTEKSQIDTSSNEELETVHVSTSSRRNSAPMRIRLPALSASRRSTRKKPNYQDDDDDYVERTKKSKKKPAAPKKPPSRKRVRKAETSDESDDEIVRRSSRNKKKIKRADSDDSDFEGTLSEESEDFSETETRTNKKQYRPVIPGERKSVRTRKEPVSHLMNMTDREFEAMIKQPKEDSKPKKGSSKKQKRQKRYDSDQEDSEHSFYCAKCKDGGDLILCDTCPKSYHTSCLNIKEVPEGEWSCPKCIAEDSDYGDEDNDSDEIDDHQTFCQICKDGGDVILCDYCTYVFHKHCLNPPMLAVPINKWKCPYCLTREDPLLGKIEKVITWKWDSEERISRTIKTGIYEDVAIEEEVPAPRRPTPEGDEDRERSPTPEPIKQVKIVQKLVRTEEVSEEVTRKPQRIFFIKYADYSYWQCSWITELQFEVHGSAKLTSIRSKFDLSVPPSRHQTRKLKDLENEDPYHLWDKYYQYGIRQLWLQIHRIINHRSLGRSKQYLVKWREIQYDQATWEDPRELPEALKDFNTHVDSYWMRRNRHCQRGGESKRDKSAVPKKSALKTKLSKQPSFLDDTGGTLHDYQLEGLNWLRFSWAQDTNTILADEMGLGKTIQGITFLYTLWKEGYVTGPILLSVPLSTITNWEREFEFWAPEMYVLTYCGHRETRVVIRENEFSYRDNPFKLNAAKPSGFRSDHKIKFDVLLTSYELVSTDKALLGSIKWDVLIIDEAHRLKNNQSLFFRVLSSYNIKYRLLLTGTPLQNNLEELFTLLNFLEPEKFIDIENFLEQFADISKEDQVSRLHEMLAPHMLRRVKSDVLKDLPDKMEFIVRIELTDSQKKMYKDILTRNYEALNARGHPKQTSLLNLMMELRKCCAHTYLFPLAESNAQLTKSGLYELSGLLKGGGKFILLSKMLKVLRKNNHRVLIFSQMTKVLDLLEDFLDAEEFGFERIDGSVMGAVRQMAIDRFNDPNSSSFVFLLSTRAGGLGINLASADTVIIFDMDWNPHNDIQAFSRAHRIGQKNDVMIYRFVCRDTVEEKIAEVAKKKMMLTELVIHKGMGSIDKTETLNKQQVSAILKFGADKLFKDDQEGKVVWDDAAVEKLCDRSQVSEMSERSESKDATGGMNEYLKSFKVASYNLKEEIEEEEEEEEMSSSAQTESSSAVDDATYWQQILGPGYQEHLSEMRVQEEVLALTLGKGKRKRKQVNYKLSFPEQDSGLPATRNETAEGPSYQPEVEELDSDELSGSDTEANAPEKPSEASSSIKLPPLMARVNGQIEVLGFTARQRRIFLDSIMRFGLPPEDAPHSQWMVREMRIKPSHVYRGYVSLFMRHICEPIDDNSDRFADGVPREGLSRQHVLTRIGMIALIRRKVQEFARKHGTRSLAPWNIAVPASQPDNVWNTPGHMVFKNLARPKEAQPSSAASLIKTNTTPLNAVNSSTTISNINTSTTSNSSVSTPSTSSTLKSSASNTSTSNTTSTPSNTTTPQSSDLILSSASGTSASPNPDASTPSGSSTPLSPDTDSQKPSTAETQSDSKTPTPAQSSTNSPTPQSEPNTVNAPDGNKTDESDNSKKCPDSSSDLTESQTLSSDVKQPEDSVNNVSVTDENVDKKHDRGSASPNSVEPMDTADVAGSKNSLQEKTTPEPMDVNECDVKITETSTLSEQVKSDSSEQVDSSSSEPVTESTSVENVRASESSKQTENSDTLNDEGHPVHSQSKPDTSKGSDAKSETVKGSDAKSETDKGSDAKPNTTKDSDATHDTNKDNNPKPDLTDNDDIVIVDSKSPEKKSAPSKPDKSQMREEFYIADGGFTVLQTVWEAEEKQLTAGREYMEWHRRHDYWLLAGIATHGYRHWQDILNDNRFAILNKPFKSDAERIRKASFLNKRFQLLEQALIIEEQLRKAVQNNATGTESINNFSSSDIDTLAVKLKSMARNGQQVDKTGQQPDKKLSKVLSQLESLVTDIRSASHSAVPTSLPFGSQLPTRSLPPAPSRGPYLPVSAGSNSATARLQSAQSSLTARREAPTISTAGLTPLQIINQVQKQWRADNRARPLRPSAPSAPTPSTSSSIKPIAAKPKNDIITID